MSQSLVQKSDAQRRLAVMLRKTLREGAGGNDLVSKIEQKALPPLLQEAAEQLRAEGGPGTRVHVEELLDRAMTNAMATWARFNPTDGGRDARYLSRDEVAAISHASPTVGAFTLRVYEAARAAATSAPATLDAAAALVKAREGLVDYLKRERIHDDDWRSYFPTSWDDAVADGILRGIEAFGTAGPDREDEVIEEADRYLFVGRGPYDLYTEVAVDKRSGELLSAYVEID